MAFLGEDGFELVHIGLGQDGFAELAAQLDHLGYQCSAFVARVEALVAAGGFEEARFLVFLFALGAEFSHESLV